MATDAEKLVQAEVDAIGNFLTSLPDIVWCVWRDHHTLSADWSGEQEIKIEAAKVSEDISTTCGYLIVENKDYIVIAPTMDVRRNTSEGIKILRSCVLALHKLQKIGSKVKGNLLGGGGKTTRKGPKRNTRKQTKKIVRS